MVMWQLYDVWIIGCDIGKVVIFQCFWSVFEGLFLEMVLIDGVCCFYYFKNLLMLFLIIMVVEVEQDIYVVW